LQLVNVIIENGSTPLGHKRKRRRRLSLFIQRIRRIWIWTIIIIWTKSVPWIVHHK